MMSGKVFFTGRKFSEGVTSFRVAEHQVGRLTGHTQEVCGLGEHMVQDDWFFNKSKSAPQFGRKMGAPWPAEVMTTVFSSGIGRSVSVQG